MSCPVLHFKKVITIDNYLYTLYLSIDFLYL